MFPSDYPANDNLARIGEREEEAKETVECGM